MKFYNKKRARKNWTKVEIPVCNSDIASIWCRRNHANVSHWYRYHQSFWFEDPATATEIILKFGK